MLFGDGDDFVNDITEIKGVNQIYFYLVAKLAEVPLQFETLIFEYLAC